MGEAPASYLSTRQAAAVLGLSPRTLESYRVKGGGPPFLVCCNRVRYLRSDLDAWALAGRRRSTSDDGGEGGCNRRGNGRRGRPHGTAAEGEAGAVPPIPAPEPVLAHLGVEELARLLGLSRRTLDRYRARGKGPAFEKVNGRVRYGRAGVEAWLAGAGTGAAADERAGS